MNDVAIRTEDIGKRYRLGDSDSIRDLLSGRSRRRTRELWAVKDVSFELGIGEVVGLVGGNGAGKSTLLKLLTRITEPTEGRAILRGRVGSLLEVGTGFHPELTGRENVYFSGAVLGMSRRDMDEHFDDIVDFSGVGPFLDTPVKRYSSGMQVRLGFAVAAHLEPEILLVDEVLAVGDAEFQRRCLGKMEDVRSHGRTVMFVSHDLGAIAELCPRSIWLEKGRLRADGQTGDVLRQYLGASGEQSGTYVHSGQDADPIQLHRAQLLAGEEPAATISADDDLVLWMDYTVREPLRSARVGATVMSTDGRVVFEAQDTDGSVDIFAERTPGAYEARLLIPGGFLLPGSYVVTLHADIPNDRVLFRAWGALNLSVVQTDGRSGVALTRRGAVFAPSKWRVERRR